MFLLQSWKGNGQRKHIKLSNMQVKDLQMKRVLRTALLVLLLGAAGMGKGYAFEVDGLYYEITSTATNTVGVTGSYLYDIVIPETVVYDGVTYSVTSIERLAFRNSAITSVTIPSSITAIKRYAFSHCSELSIVYFNATNCIIMGESDGSGNPFGYAFNNCSSLATLNIGPNVEHIPAYGFNACTSLTAVNITNIDSWYNIDFETNPLSMAHNLYLNGELLSNLVIPETVSEIKPNAFSGATCLTNLTLPNSIISIGEGAFSGCNNIGGTLTIPESVEFIGGWAFAYCTSLTVINYNAINCQSMGCVNVYGDFAFRDCTSINTINIGDNVHSIPHHAFTFLSFSGSSDLSIPNSVVSIGNSAFEGCSNLSSVSIGNSVVSIGDYAFVGTELASIMIGNSMSNIGNGAFMGCSNLNTIIALGTIPPTLGTDAFSSISPVATLFVPCGSLMAYFSNWNIFEYNNIHEDCTPRPVSIDSSITGGSVTPSVSQASMGQEVMLTVIPNPGMQLVSITAHNTNNPSQIVPISPIGNSYRFVMPPYAVTVSASFETYELLKENNVVAAEVYPNPTTGSVKIEAEDIRQIYISNTLGQLIYEGSNIGNEFEYNFSQQGEGIYLICIETTNGIITKRVVVMR